MGQPRLAEEDSHQVVPVVLNSENFIEAHQHNQVYLLRLMGLGDVGSPGFVPSPAQVQQMLGPAQHHVDQGGAPYPWNYGGNPHLQHSQQQEISRSSHQSGHYSHRNQGVTNKKYNTWNNKNSGRYVYLTKPASMLLTHLA